MAWYDNDWDYRVKITIDSGEVDADLTDYPVYVDLSDLPAGFFSNVKSAGEDIRVTKSDGTTEVAREVVFITTGSSIGELHFLAAGTLSSSSDTDFYIYYGNAAASEPAVTATYGRNNVWNANYAAVYHLQEDPSGSAPQEIDSTGSGYDGTSEGSMTSGDLIDAQISKGLDLDGSGDAIDIGTTPDWSETDTFTWQTWAKTSSGATKTIIAKATNTAPYTGINFYLASSKLTLSFVPTAGTSYQLVRRGTNTYSDGAWHSFYATYDGLETDTGIHLYEDGVEPTYSISTDNWSGKVLDTTKRLKLGERDGGLNWAGGLDEARMSNVVLTSTWVSTEYSNQNSPATFYTTGAEETNGVAEQPAIFFGMNF